MIGRCPRCGAWHRAAGDPEADRLADLERQTTALEASVRQLAADAAAAETAYTPAASPPYAPPPAAPSNDGPGLGAVVGAALLAWAVLR